MAEDTITISSGDTAYKWVVRGLYTSAILLNLWYLIEQYRDTPEGERMLKQAKAAKSKILSPVEQAKKWRRMVTETILEAWIVVDNAKKESEKE